jgi:predicted DNA-binding transcriptional regulator YafY
MRASRLLSILMTLQARGRVTAQALADQCEVSLRTIYRDVDALSAAGVPVYSDRGSAGGYRLLEGYRTRLNGLSLDEAKALFLSGLTGPAAALGLGPVMAGAQLKLTAALPAEMRAAAERMRACFHLDAPGWFEGPELPLQLREIAVAVWDQRMIEMRYRSWKAETRRKVAPLGLVLKSGAWYLVGAVDNSARTYRIARIREVNVLGDAFRRPPDFDLEAYWVQSTHRLESKLHRGRATVRLSPLGYRMLEPLTSAFVRGLTEIGEADADGFRTVVMPVGSLWQAASELLRFGVEAEVLAPPELRQKMRDITEVLRSRYVGDAADQSAEGR